MPVFHPPVRDLAFVLEEITGLPGCDTDLARAVLEEAGRFAADILAPLDPVGDREGCRLADGRVSTPPGFAAAWARFAEAGWNGVSVASADGGQGLPPVLGMAVQELWQGANMAFALVPMLTQTAAETLATFGTPEQKRLYLPPLVSGAWTGTMVLTEPQAGSDLGAIRTRAVRDGEAWRLSGQKIFITGGDHDLTPNIVHMVLARTEGAPAGTKGLSLFLVPKVLVAPDGSLAGRNDVACLRLEHKMGLHGSPTCALSFGDGGGAQATLVGREGGGMEAMGAMMARARQAVAVQGVGQAERAWQKARTYARQRVQGRDADGRSTALIGHADIRRMLMTCKTLTEAARALALFTAAADGPLAGLLTPVAKAFGTATGLRVADTALQVFGGMGYVEETGIARHLRDVRVAAIYEGTNGIQALALVNRRFLRDGGATLALLLDRMRATEGDLAAASAEPFPLLRRRLAETTTALAEAAGSVRHGAAADPAFAAAVAVPFLDLTALAAAAWLSCRAALAAARRREQAAAARRREQADGERDAFLDGKVAAARFFAETMLPRAAGLKTTIDAGSQGLMTLDEECF